MQLISRTTLIYQAGSSDKIYEIDLCQTGENRYLVNCRYGRRGTTLKEGTKTIQAVPLAEAVRVFDKLVDSKIQKGYCDSQQLVSNPSPPLVITKTTSNDVSNHILYENSPRYISHPQAWLCSQSYKPGDNEPNVTEEAFPELWQKHPAALLQLLLESSCHPVHHFAVKALRTYSEFCELRFKHINPITT